MAEQESISNIIPELKQTQWDGMDRTQVPWYQAEIEQLRPEAQELFEKYANVPSERVRSHIKEARDKAYEIFPYPCLARWAFLELSLSALPEYPEILERVKKGEKYLDIGCCVGQDIRKLVFDGAPSENTYGSDLRKEFMDIGYDLFLDQSTLKSTFVAADIFDKDSGLKELEGKIDIVHGASFLHLFNLEDQTKACKRIVQILKAAPGSIFIGRQLGNIEASDQDSHIDPSQKRFRHSPDSFKEMWKHVSEEAGGEWDVVARLESVDLHSLAEKAGIKASFISDGSRFLNFAVRRVS